MKDKDKPMWFGQDLERAKQVAKKKGWMVIYSLAPGKKLRDPDRFFGYWVDKKDTMIRNFEKVIE